ncbi:tripartite ATP-independent transporter DctM subunit [Aliiruegeria haliotis]|uniref:TRAP transporter large permease protein n=1 Tax=Aliiruegeria haliotis TaxID=1280846 RepID=A0A2T0RDX7_9RHOB|nr:TRAP transporter large permease [Aliiruegeria haliotis]PRY19343.1 tripartite ATP-independent transporter DctM subunit [Aliiruegeria haliotis]
MVTDPVASAILIGSFVGMLLLGTRIFLAMGISAVVTLWYMGVPLMVVFQKIVNGVSSFSFLAIPFFIMAGDIMTAGGISDRIIRLSKALIGWIRGGLAMVNIMASMFFGGISGSPVADVSSLGAVLIPMMDKEGYDRDFSTTVTMSSAVQGLLVPPSHNMIIFAMAAGSVSISGLFMGGLIPGVFLGLALMIYCYMVSLKRNYPVSNTFSVGELFDSFFSAFWGLLTVFIIVFGVLTGVFTATESSSMAVLWAAIVTFFIYRQMTIKEFWNVLGRTLQPLSQIMIIIGCAGAFGWVVTWLKIPEYLVNNLFAFVDSKIAFLIMANLLMLFLGTLVGMSAQILILTPIMLPFLDKFDISYIHFGVIMIFNLGIGLITPPVGGVLFVGSAVSKLPIEKLSKSMLPFYGVMVLALLVITYVPDLTLFLPRLMGLEP